MRLHSDRAVAADGRGDAVTHAAGALSVSLLADGGGAKKTAVFRVRGEVDLSTAPVLAEVLRPVIQAGTGLVVVDLAEVSFMDSSGVHVLLAAHRQLEPQDRRITIACPANGQVHRLLDLTGLLHLLQVRPSPEDRYSAARRRIDRDSSLTQSQSPQRRGPR